MLKRFTSALILILATAMDSYAATGIVKGKIKNFRVNESKEFANNWAPPLFWFTLEGVTSACNCQKWYGNPLFVMDSQMAFSTILEYQLAGKEVAIYFDDSKLNSENAWCRALYVTGGDQVPLN